MYSNPYKYKGPLDPERDSLICIPRSKDLNRVIEGIIKGEYWAVMGPRQIGKTTFLRQIQHEFPDAYYIYLDFEISHSNEEIFYRWLIEQILKKVPSQQKKDISKVWAKEKPEFKFLRFLETFKPRDDNKKIILLLDEIDDLPSLRTFLHIWRKVYHERFEKEVLNQYAVIITGSVDLIELTDGPTSPFNIAEILYIKDFSVEESEKLIVEPMKQLHISIVPEAQKYLIPQVSGHPQMLQQLCYILVEIALASKRTITKKDVDYAIKTLFKNSSPLDKLRRDLKINNILTDLLRDIILNKELKKYFPYKEFSISGVGAIVDDNDFCAIRNKIFERFLKDIPEIKDSSPPPRIRTFICYSNKDEQWKESLCEYLKPLEFKDILEVWDDHMIPAGENFYSEIEKHLKSSDMAIFLMSKHSLSSEFIMTKEIPILLERRKKGELILIPILVRRCAWKAIEELAEIEIRPKDKIPLSRKNAEEQDDIIVEIVNEIAKRAKEIRKNKYER